MYNEAYKSLFSAFGLPLNEEDQEELPFEETSMTKEECFDMCRKTLVLLENCCNKPYTLFKFKETCNDLARKKADWKSYYEVCAKYIEFFVYKDKGYVNFERKYYLK